MPDGYERTAEERDDARRERERTADQREEARRRREQGWRANGTAARRSAPQRRRSGRPSRLRKWGGRFLAVLALALAVGAIWFLFQLYQPFHGSPHGSVTVTIQPHSTSREIGDELARAGVVSSGFFFDLRATLAGERGDLRAGTYKLQQDMTYSKALKVLTTAPAGPPVTNITIIEGRTRAQINDLLKAQGVKGSYFVATRHSPLINFAADGAPKHTPDLEGFLFPDTYQLVEPISIPALVTDQLKTFRQQWAQVNLRYARSRALTPYDVLIIASMVQAEAATARDRPLIASVIYNRLRLGMPLQIDATTRYATGNYTKPLTDAQLNSNSPYNTRIHKGLTPTPIDNPGLASMQAAAHPAQTNYLYFVVKPCGNGEQVFTSNYSQFLADAQKYQAARTARGGKSPERCS
jgi:peptidoglycan lytic transglycosylase G